MIAAARALLLFMALCCGSAFAQTCSFTMPNINFGSIDVTANITYSATANFTASCTGTAGSIVRICPNFGAGTGGVNANGTTRYLLSGSTQLQYNIYQNNSYSQVWGSYIWGNSRTPPTIEVTLGSSGTGSISRIVRARISSGQTSAPVGTYTSSFSGANTRINYAYSTAGNCSTISSSNLNPVQTPFTVTTTTGSACAISTTDMDFGSRTLLNTVTDATNSFSIRCPNGTPYAIGLNGGLSNASDPTSRKMENGLESVTYAIYQNAARTSPWGDAIGTNTVSATGSGTFQSYTGYGRIPVQPTPAADIYSDTVIITVTY